MDRRHFIGAGAAGAVNTLLAGAALPSDTGVRMVQVVGGKHRVWTRKVGSGAVKVLLLHGGPGFSHDYLEALESFLPGAGIEFYYYDQLGSNRSDQPEDPSLWTLPRFVEEVEEVRRGLGLDRFVLYGHSWGGMLAIDYALKYQQNLHGLVISNMTAGIQSYLKRIDVLKTWLPPAMQTRLQAIEAKQDRDSAEYDAILMQGLYPQIMCRLDPWPEPVLRSFGSINLRIFNQMWGRSEFRVTGNLKDWERWDRFHQIRTRTLSIGARYDEMDPDDMRRIATLMPNAAAAICPNGSHLCMWDDPANYFDALVPFLKSL